MSAQAFGAELLTNGDFEQGNGIGFSSQYTYVAATGHSTLWGEGTYAIGKDPYDYHANWVYGPHGDHTTPDDPAVGKMMIVNGSVTPNKIVWAAPAVSVLPGRIYSFSFWGAKSIGEAPPTLDLYINDIKVDTYVATGAVGEWVKYDYHWMAGSATTAALKLVSPTLAASGNDYCLDDFSLTEYVAQVTVDIKPMSDPNAVNNDGRGVIPVAILGSETFDVTTINPATVALDGMAVRFKGKSMTAQASIEDYNMDGYDDLIVHIADTDGTFAPGQTVGTVTGLFWAGGAFSGTDSLKIVPAP
jgi:hypothetical protein